MTFLFWVERTEQRQKPRAWRMLRNTVLEPRGGYAPKAGGRQQRRVRWWESCWAGVGGGTPLGNSSQRAPTSLSLTCPGKKRQLECLQPSGVLRLRVRAKRALRDPPATSSHYPEDVWKLREGRKSPSSPVRKWQSCAFKPGQSSLLLHLNMSEGFFNLLSCAQWNMTLSLWHLLLRIHLCWWAGFCHRLHLKVTLALGSSSGILTCGPLCTSGHLPGFVTCCLACVTAPTWWPV